MPLREKLQEAQLFRAFVAIGNIRVYFILPGPSGF
jgi:hypothetical protein